VSTRPALGLNTRAPNVRVIRPDTPRYALLPHARVVNPEAAKHKIVFVLTAACTVMSLYDLLILVSIT
jgi:hypothetical protein